MGSVRSGKRGAVTQGKVYSCNHDCTSAVRFGVVRRGLARSGQAGQGLEQHVVVWQRNSTSHWFPVGSLHFRFGAA